MKTQLLIAILVTIGSLLRAVGLAQTHQNSLDRGASVFHPKVRQDTEGDKTARSTDPILRPIVVHYAAFTGPEHGASAKYAAQFQAALEKYLTPQGITAGRSNWIVTGQVLHVEGPDTPFLALVSLYHANLLIGCWSGRAESVFHFNDRLRDPTLHRYGLAGEIGDRLRTALSAHEAQRMLRSRLDTLQSADMNLSLENLETANESEFVPIRTGALISAHPDARVRLRLEAPEARSIIILGEDRSGRWIPLYVPDQEEGVFDANTLRLPLDLKSAFNGDDSLTVWVITADTNTFRKVLGKTSKPDAVSVLEASDPVSPSSSEAAVLVLSGTPSQSELWQRNPMLRELTLGGSGVFHAIRFTLRRSTDQSRRFTKLSYENS